MVHTNLRSFCHQVHAECAVRGHVIPFHKLAHVESVVVAGCIEVIARIGRIRFNEIVGANEALWLACDNLEIAPS